MDRDKEMVAEISLMKNGIFIIKDGRMEVLDAPPQGHGKQTITWADGKPINIENYFTKRI